MKSKLIYGHSADFYEKKYEKVKQWARSKKIQLPWKDQTGFEIAYDDYRRKGSKNPLSTIKYNLQYKTDLETAKAELQFIKAANINDKVKLKDLKSMTTQEFYDKYKNEIEDYRNELKKGYGINSYQANKLISMHFFGSN